MTESKKPKSLAPADAPERTALARATRKELQAMEKGVALSPDGPKTQVLEEATYECHRAAAAANSPKEFVAALNGDANALQKIIQKSFGVEGANFATALYSDSVNWSINRNTHPEEFRLRLFAALEGIIALNPKGALQSMLAIQMVSIHSAAMKAIAKGQAATEIEANALYLNQAGKLMRTYAQQAELLARLQGKIKQQIVRVERVNVSDGGQALVGAIGPGYGGNDIEK